MRAAYVTSGYLQRTLQQRQPVSVGEATAGEGVRAQAVLESVR